MNAVLLCPHIISSVIKFFNFEAEFVSAICFYILTGLNWYNNG